MTDLSAQSHQLLFKLNQSLWTAGCWILDLGQNKISSHLIVLLGLGVVLRVVLRVGLRVVLRVVRIVMMVTLF